MKTVDPRTLLGVLSLLVVLWAVRLELERTSPGPLSAPHAGVAELEGVDGCRLCHGGGPAQMAGACGTCHTAITVQSERGAGLHGSLAPRTLADCGACHDEHHGRTLALVTDASFAALGFPTRDAFEHTSLELDLAGRHAELACVECHAAAEAEELAPGEGRFLGLPRACEACHDSPHGEGFLAPEGERTASPSGADCGTCHDAARGPFGGSHASLSAARHEAAGFSLAPPHAGLDCERCHGLAGELSFAERFPGRRADDCRACHGDPHGGQFAGAPEHASCLDCHRARAFLPATFDLEQHAATSYPLRGAHRAVQCDGCHVAGGPGSTRTFRGTPSTCSSCHGDPHRGALRGDGEDACERCHTTASFSAVSENAFDHDASTHWRLAGAHRDVDCDGCHPRAATADGLGRRFGFVEEVFGSPRSCSSCHDDPHGGAFARAPASAGGAPDCSLCHTTTTFLDLVTPFQHGPRTGFAIEVLHGAVDCAGCHAQDAPGEPGRLARVPGRACLDCHGDPHLGQFARAGGTDCSRCHSEPLGEVFDHQSDASFALDERHIALDCAACHRPWSLAGGGTAVRYRPLGTECADCHGPVGAAPPAMGGRE